MKHIVCYSGGHSSALVAIEVVNKYGKENVILLNHNISPKVEHEDIKRFKDEISEYTGVDITYANMECWEEKDQFDVCLEKSGFQFQAGNAICTYNMKTLPFYKWLKENYPVKKGEIREDIKIYYGYDKEEVNRIAKRTQVMYSSGYIIDCPLTWNDRTIQSTEEIGIERPITYGIHKHANCIGCIKAGRQSWYLNYCLYPELFEKAKQTEEILGHSIIKGIFLSELEPKFKEMKERDIKANENVKASTFWKTARLILKEDPNQIRLPCDCGI
jgi:hypothetical protein